MVDQGLSLKICGLTDCDQACEVAAMGVDAIGVIGVPDTPRFVEPNQRRAIFQSLTQEHPVLKRVWVVADPSDAQLASALSGEGKPTVVQLHGEESPQRCADLRRLHPGVDWWKALRLRGEADLNGIDAYFASVDALLLDAWSPNQLGGTGHRLDPAWLERLQTRLCSDLPWWLAGGISAEWIPTLLDQVTPFGLDASSRLEHSPGVKDLRRVEALVKAVRVKSGKQG
ncbi:MULTISPECIES: phosphoribosylanthranilate isomerase [unclassified Synechococcus]|uniref:phosphoribosylanthranilate isomerase n=1 Tax=unclassified Synechococcus TaxID=2626047 RepID=UPI00082C4F8F|nr:MULTISPECIES: phosphoribosylanthranilate isomerase [unclassified Synechococcus]